MVTTFGTLIEAIEIVKALPGVVDAVSRLGLTFKNLVASKDKELPKDSLIVVITTEEQKRLRNLIDEYYLIDKDKQADTIEKNKARKRIAAQACVILKSWEPFKDQIPDYKHLYAFFCEAVPTALAGG